MASWHIISSYSISHTHLPCMCSTQAGVLPKVMRYASTASWRAVRDVACRHVMPFIGLPDDLSHKSTNNTHIDYKWNGMKFYLSLSLWIICKYHINTAQVTYYFKGQKTIKGNDAKSYLLLTVSNYIWINIWQMATCWSIDQMTFSISIFQPEHISLT